MAHERASKDLRLCGDLGLKNRQLFSSVADNRMGVIVGNNSIGVLGIVGFLINRRKICLDR